MENSRKAHERAEAALGLNPERHEKGSAVRIIAAEARATQEKTARLKKLRMAREADDAATAAVAPAKKARASKATRKVA